MDSVNKIFLSSFGGGKAAANAGMTTDELEFSMKRLLLYNYSSHSVNFMGVFAFDEFPRSFFISSTPPSSACACIVNIDPIGKPDRHWVAFYREGMVLEFFDSYANSAKTYNFDVERGAPKDLIQLSNKIPLQSFSTTVCGQYCLVFIYFRSRIAPLPKYLFHYSHQLNSVVGLLRDLAPSKTERDGKLILLLNRLLKRCPPANPDNLASVFDSCFTMLAGGKASSSSSSFSYPTTTTLLSHPNQQQGCTSLLLSQSCTDSSPSNSFNISSD